MQKKRPILLVILFYLAVGSLYAIQTPAWQAPDEPAHYNYVRQLADGIFPVMQMGDYDQIYLETIVGSHFDSAYDPALLTYEDWQPPLYYLLQTPVYMISDGSLLAMRLFSVLLGAGTLFLAYLIGREVVDEWVGLTTAVFVAFLPQHLAIMGSVNNDALAELLIGLTLYCLLKLVREKTNGRWALGVGLFLGLGFLTKGTNYLMAPVVVLGLGVAYWQAQTELKWIGLRIFPLALGLGGIWWGRNIALYGGFDILGKAVHDSVVVGQPRTSELVADVGLWGAVSRFVQTSFNSFWGQFGWMAIPFPRWVYLPLALFTLLVLVGLGVRLFSQLRTIEWTSLRAYVFEDTTAVQTLILTLLVGGALALLVLYNLTFIQHQGRYLFPALIPIGVGVSVGTAVYLRPLPLPKWVQPVALAFLLIGLNLFALIRVIVPYFVWVGVLPPS